MIRERRGVIALLIFLVPSASLMGAEQASIVLTAQENGTISQTEFSCDRTIHGYLRLPERVIGKHELESVWTRPDKKMEADSHSVVTFLPPGRSTAYVWFSFPERSRPGTIDPEGDSKRLAYPGTWKVQIQWDKKPLLQSSFIVHCP